jgi:hypothetical protein
MVCAFSNAAYISGHEARKIARAISLRNKFAVEIG